MSSNHQGARAENRIQQKPNEALTRPPFVTFTSRDTRHSQTPA